MNAPFHIIQPTGAGRIDTVFQCAQKEGVVPPLATIRIPVSHALSTDYLPTAVHMSVIFIYGQVTLSSMNSSI